MMSVGGAVRGARAVGREDSGAGRRTVVGFFDGLEQKILGVPARIELPRLVFASLIVGLMLFGLLMIYSASSIKALNETGDPTYYVTRQLLMEIVGLIAGGIIVLFGYRWLNNVKFLWFTDFGCTLLLLATRYLGSTTNGATRWIALPLGIRFQPSEIAKPVVILMAAVLLEEFANDPDSSLNPFTSRGLVTWVKAFLGVLLPMGLIAMQPDKGSTLVLGLSLLAMLYLSGVFKTRYIVFILFIVLAGGVYLSMHDDYSRARIVTMWDPWLDPYGDGYQLTQGFIAFGLGGLGGTGVGMSMQKYSYLPEAHNDFIFAIVGEELGLVGTLAVVAVFVGLLWAGFQIGRHAPDARGRLIADGCTLLLVLQFLLNVAGVLGIFPLSGKPVPLLSYGGTAAIAFLIDAALVYSVSRSSGLPTTEHERQRSSLRVAGEGEEDAFDEPFSRDSFMAYGAPSRLQSDVRARRGTRDPQFRLVDSARTMARSAGPDGVPLEGGVKGARLTRRDGRDRIELGRTSYDRLRGGRDERDRGSGSRPDGRGRTYR